jgi:hypothetical protein
MNRRPHPAGMTAGLEAFIKQWNACGPNSDFGRQFQAVRDEAVKALAAAKVSA